MNKNDGKHGRRTEHEMRGQRANEALPGQRKEPNDSINKYKNHSVKYFTHKGRAEIEMGQHSPIEQRVRTKGEAHTRC